MPNDNESSDNDNDIEIIPEVWLKALLAIAGDKERKAKVIQRIAEKTGHSPEQVEEIITVTIEVMNRVSRSN